MRTRMRILWCWLCRVARPTGSSRTCSWLLIVLLSGAYSISLYSRPQHPVVDVVAGVGHDDWYGCRFALAQA